MTSRQLLSKLKQDKKYAQYTYNLENDLEILEILLNDIDHLKCKVDEDNRRYIDFGGKYPVWYEYDNNDDEFETMWDWLQERRNRK